MPALNNEKAQSLMEELYQFSILLSMYEYTFSKRTTLFPTGILFAQGVPVIPPPSRWSCNMGWPARWKQRKKKFPYFVVKV